MHPPAFVGFKVDSIRKKDQPHQPRDIKSTNKSNRIEKKGCRPVKRPSKTPLSSSRIQKDRSKSLKKPRASKNMFSRKKSPLYSSINVRGIFSKNGYKPDETVFLRLLKTVKNRSRSPTRYFQENAGQRAGGYYDQLKAFSKAKVQKNLKIKDHSFHDNSNIGDDIGSKTTSMIKTENWLVSARLGRERSRSSSSKRNTQSFRERSGLRSAKRTSSRVKELRDIPNKARTKNTKSFFDKPSLASSNYKREITPNQRKSKKLRAKSGLKNTVIAIGSSVSPNQRRPFDQLRPMSETNTVQFQDLIARMYEENQPSASNSPKRKIKKLPPSDDSFSPQDCKTVQKKKKRKKSTKPQKIAIKKGKQGLEGSVFSNSYLITHLHQTNNFIGR